MGVEQWSNRKGPRDITLLPLLLLLFLHQAAGGLIGEERGEDDRAEGAGPRRDPPPERRFDVVDVVVVVVIRVQVVGDGDIEEVPVEIGARDPEDCLQRCSG